MPLQNRVDPFGTIHIVEARGTMMGNRGGRVHDPATKTLNKRFASKRWIACVCEFRGRQRNVMGHSYTELFFLDEVTAFAAGHRPCAECRRADFKRFSQVWCEAFGMTDVPKADDMDEVLHRERCVSGIGAGVIAFDDLATLPNGAMIALEGLPYAKKSGQLLPWNFHGYSTPIERSETHGAHLTLLTPPSISKVFKQGYHPTFHHSATSGR